MSASIEVEGLAKRFGNVQAVRNLSFTVNEGELFGFLGPNGTGKTTVNMLAGLARPDAGKIRIGCINCTTNLKAAQYLIGLDNAFVPILLSLFLTDLSGSATSLIPLSHDLWRGHPSRGLPWRPSVTVLNRLHSPFLLLYRPFFDQPSQHWQTLDPLMISTQRL